MALLTTQSIKFLRDLKKNNNREWFHENKKRYESDLKKPFHEFVQAVIDGLQKFDPDIQIEPKQAIFRINRDIRFSKDKSPYKTHVGALISAKGRKDKGYPGYYVHLEGGQLMLGGGAYFLDKEPLYALRQKIMTEGKRFEKLLKTKSFKDKFGTLKGDVNKRIPKEFAEAAEAQPLIFNKQFYYMSEHKPDLALDKAGVKNALAYFKAGKIMNDFFIEAISK